MHEIKSLLILGCGYVGERLAKGCIAKGLRVLGTTRSCERAEALRAMGMEAVVADSPLDLAAGLLRDVDAVVDSIPLERTGKNMHASQVDWLRELAARMPHIRWAGYLSTTGVYGDANGAWVDESWPCDPKSPRGIERLKAEQAWLGSGVPAEVFRLAGIYGPERNIIARLQAGGYKAVRWQPAHYASRIHVDDIVAALLAAMTKPRPGRIVNLADDLPLPHDEYVIALASIINAPAPCILSPEEGEAQLSSAMLDFFRDNKRVSNRLLHAELIPELKYPDFLSAAADLTVATAAKG